MTVAQLEAMLEELGLTHDHDHDHEHDRKRDHHEEEMFEPMTAEQILEIYGLSKTENLHKSNFSMIAPAVVHEMLDYAASMPSSASLLLPSFVAFFLTFLSLVFLA